MNPPTTPPNIESPSSLRRRIFNPHRLSDADLERSFIVRQQTLSDLLQDIAAEAANSHPQHHLLCGQRGMGKTTLLLRIALELRRDPLRNCFIPLTFPEDQYVEVDRLSKFWLNCLDALADALEQEGGQNPEVERIDDTVKGIDVSSADESTIEAQSREAFADAALRLERRPVLLIDNFNLLLARLRGDDYKLRGFFGASGAPVIVASSVTVPAELQDYGAAFYDGFKTHFLRPLSLDELREVIVQLAHATGHQDLLTRLPGETPRLAALRDLTGGNPRTAVLLFEMFSQGFSEDAYEDLESLLDLVTPLYQSRLSQLSDQAQVIVGTLARHWSPASAATLSALARIPASSVSPQLGRLEELGLVEKTTLFPEKKTGYQIAERFFNIWYLMRFSTRRQRTSLACLTRFLQEFHTPAQLEGHARRLLARRSLDGARIPYAMALAGALPERPELAHHLEIRAQLELVQQTEGIRERIAEVLDPEEIDPRVLTFAELERTLRQSVPSGGPVTGKEFADLVLGSPAMLAGDGARGATRHSIATSPLDTRKVREIVRQLRRERKVLERRHGSGAVDWLASRLREGLITSWEEAREISLALLEADSPAAVRVILTFASARAKTNLGEDAFGKVRNALGPSGDSGSGQWYNWGALLHLELARYEEAEGAYRQAIEIDPQFAHPWNNLGNLLQYLARYEEAEAAYRRAIEIDPQFAGPWNGLGNLLQDYLARYGEAEAAFHRAIEIDPQFAYPWNGLGNLLQDYLARYEEAEVAYRQAIAIDPQYAYPWNGLGNLLQDHLGRYEEARQAFERALELAPNEDSPRHNLAFLLRDSLGRPAEARRILADLHDRETLKDTQALHEALFAAYDENWGLAADALRRALGETGFRLPPYTRDDWFRASAVLLHLGYGEKLVALLEAEGADVKMLPWFATVSAHAQGDRRYLVNVPAESRPVAEQIYDEIQLRRDRLPPR